MMIDDGGYSPQQQVYEECEYDKRYIKESIIYDLREDNDVRSKVRSVATTTFSPIS
jgi:hypothetical protein